MYLPQPRSGAKVSRTPLRLKYLGKGLLIDGYARLSRKEGTGNRKQSNMADSTALFELESFAIKKVGTFDELAVDTD